MFSFQRNVAKDTQRTGSLIEIWDSRNDTTNAIGCISTHAQKCHVSCKHTKNLLYILKEREKLLESDVFADLNVQRSENSVL